MSTIPDDLAVQCVFIDYVYDDLVKQVNAFNVNDLFIHYTPCGKQYIYCLYYFLKDMSFFNLLNVLEDKCTTNCGSCFLKVLNDSYQNPNTGCIIKPSIRIYFESNKAHKK